MEMTTSFHKGGVSTFLCELQGWVLQRKNVAFPFLEMFINRNDWHSSIYGANHIVWNVPEKM